MSVSEAPDSYNVDSYDGTEDIALRRGHRVSYSDATRYLCAGAELDEDFALGVIRELFAQPKRAVAPSYGIDVVPIVKHALKGRRRRAIRDIALMLLLLPLLVFFPIPTLLAVALVILLQVANLQSRLQGRVAGLALALAGIVVAAWWLSGQSNQLGRTLRASVPTGTSSLLAAGGMGRLNLFLITLLAVLVLAVVFWY